HRPADVARAATERVGTGFVRWSKAQRAVPTIDPQICGADGGHATLCPPYGIEFVDSAMRRVIFPKVLMLASMLLASAPVQAEIRIIQSPGGQVGPFLDLFEKVRASGERVVIDGPCLSACTLVLSIVP